MNVRIGMQEAGQSCPMASKMLVLTVLLSTLVACGRTMAQQAELPADVLQQRGQRLEQMKSKGPDATLTILPMRVVGRPLDRLTEVLGLLLEQQGLKQLELGETTFDPEVAMDIEQLAAAVGEFVKQQPITTEYALYAEFNGNARERRLDDVRAVVVDKIGEVVWTAHLTSQDETFKRLQAHPDLLKVSVFLAQRVGPQFGLNEETAKTAKPGKMAQLMDQRSGLPPEEERVALAEREKTFRAAGPDFTLTVFPPRIGGRVADVENAAELVNAINDAALCKAAPAKEAIELKSSQADPNELKALWDFAREFREYVRKNSPQTDYVLVADYAFNANHWEQGFVHFVLCDQKGEWVLVDMQNSHHADYQNVKPTSKEDCDRLLIRRLQDRLQ